MQKHTIGGNVERYAQLNQKFAKWSSFDYCQHCNKQHLKLSVSIENLPDKHDKYYEQIYIGRICTRMIFGVDMTGNKSYAMRRLNLELSKLSELDLRQIIIHIRNF